MAIFQSIRARRKSHSLIKKWGINTLNIKLRKLIGNTVMSGPFEGLKLPDAAFSEHVGPYLFGSYENELNVVWEKIFTKDYDQIIDIGCKFGFYAVGLAKKFPKAMVYAFDIDPWARLATRRSAELNGVNNITVGKFFEKDFIRNSLKPNSLIICDVDGAEFNLFGSDLKPFLGKADAIIELHDCFVDGCEQAVRSAFPEERSCSLIELRKEKIERTEFSFLSREERILALNEIRPDQKWICWT
jgi:hypothetical protein